MSEHMAEYKRTRSEALAHDDPKDVAKWNAELNETIAALKKSGKDGNES